MRTTVTLDPDLGAQLKELARQRQVSFREVLNATIRAGLATDQPRSRPFVVEARSMGMHPGFDIDRALRLADQLTEGAIIKKSRLGNPLV